MKTSSPHRLHPAPHVARRRLLIVESGACALSREGAERFDETVAIAQLREEPPDELAHRVLARVASVERSQMAFDAATLFVSAATGPAAASARRLMALAIAANAARSARLNELLVVVTSPDPSDALREQLLDLVDDLRLNPDQPLSVRVCFAATHAAAVPDSGVFWRLDNDR